MITIKSFLILFSISVCSIGAVKFIIDQSNEECEQACLHKNLSQNNVFLCCSIEHVVMEYGFNISNIEIVLSGEIKVTGFVLFKNISHLLITGKNSESKAILNCSGFIPRGSLPGFQFVKVKSLHISNVEITECGARHLFVNDIVTMAAVVLTNCSDASLVNMEISRSNDGISLLIENHSINLSLERVVVRRNKVSQKTVNSGMSFTRGVFIYVNSSHGQSHYRITSCLFEYIKTPKYKSYDAHKAKDTTNWLGHGLGGGLSIIFDEDSAQNTVLVENCTFQYNTAPWGAGMYLGFRKHSSNNSVNLTDSNFCNCRATIAGGGLEVGSTKASLDSNDNRVFVMNLTFRKNHAMHGAGTRIIALPSKYLPEKGEFVTFSNCSWIENTAIYSPAVDISTTHFELLGNGTLPIPVFIDCKFLRNTIQFKEKKATKYITWGVFVVTRFTVSFSGEFCFEANNFTAFLLNSGKVILEKNTRIQFINNTGFRGGAIALNGFSYLSVSDNCLVEFYNNTATEYGGAIFYYPIEQREFFEGRVCFLHYTGQHDFPVSARNISFVFANNSAGVSGSSIYSTSLYACYFTYRGSLKNHLVNEFFEEIGTFTFDGMASNNISSNSILGTAGRTFIRTGNQSLTSLPGMKLLLPLTVNDELNQEIKSDFLAQILPGSNTSIYLPNAYTVNRSVVLYGAPNDRASLAVSTQHTYRSIQYSIDITLSSCPPGFYYFNSTCTCSNSNSSHKAYRGIVKCNHDSYTAVIKRGYWAGYLSPNSTELYTASCPIHFCAHNRLTRDEYSLPNSPHELSSYMCGPKRRGVLCAECTENHSVYYHSKAFTCGSNDKCSYGILFFFLSELFPVLIFFTLTVIFDWSFSSGSRNGFVFFSQMVTILPLDYITSEAQQPTAEYLQIGYRIIYGFFNIDFFSVEPLSYCLFQNATVMDALAFKYITTVFALILVISLTVCINRCTCCNTLCTKLKKKLTTKESMLNGLSAFLVICYLESVRTSLFILRLRTLWGAGGISGPVVAFYSGNNYFEGKHVFYAIPALITLGTIGFVPPMLLLLYPALLKLLQLCKVSEHKFVLAALRVTRLNALLPMLDVFQGHFKDNLRFFAGLYFLYRVALLLAYSFSPNLFVFAVVGELVLFLISSFHSVAQPYKQSKYNIVDSLLLSNLAIINGLSVFVLTISSESSTDVNKFLIIAAIYLQLGLIYLPLVVIVSLFTVKVCKYARQRVKRSSNDDGQELLGYLEYLDDNRESDKDSVQETGDHQVW